MVLALAAGACGDPDTTTDGGTSSASSTGGLASTSGVDPTTGGPGSTGPGGTDASSGSSSSGGSSGSSSGGADTSGGGSSTSTGGDTTGGTEGSSGGVSGTEGTGTTGTGTGDTGGSGSTGVGPEEFVAVQILAFNDFHGNIEPPSGSSGKILLPDNTMVDTGGAAFLATHVKQLRATNPNTIVVSAGDLIGASPLVSALFHDEPTVEVMNKIGLDYNAVGNHEFDDGWKELLRMQAGGCHPIDGCVDGSPFPGAEFQFLAANVLTQDDPVVTLFPSYAIHEVGGVQIAFIGMTLEGTPEIVTPSGVAGLTFVDEAERANALVPELTAKGIAAIVVLIHEGGLQTGYFDQCVGISGAIVDIVNALAPEIDLVVSGHTHQAYNCVINEKVVTSAASFGRLITDIDLEISALSGEVSAATAKNVLVTRELADAKVESFVAEYKTLVAPLANKPIGKITDTLVRFPVKDGPGTSTMGLVIADAQLAATADVMLGGAEIAFMNQGGVRADMLYPAAPGEPSDGIVSYGEAFTVQPFGNSLVVMTLTGAQIKTMLEQQFPPGFERVLQPSKGFTYTWKKSGPPGNKVDPASMKLLGVTIDPVKEYRVTVNSFLASGGDGFGVLVGGTDKLGGVTDIEALEAYFADNSPVVPPPLDRVTLVP